MQTGIYLLCFFTGFIMESSATFNYNMKDKTINKASLCSNSRCNIIAGHDIIINVYWTITAPIDNPTITIVESSTLLHRVAGDDLYYLCPPTAAGKGIVVTKQKCTAKFSSGDKIFDLPALKASSSVGAQGTVFIKSSNGLNFGNNVTVTK